MKFSELWLREWVNPELTASELTDQITMAGLEVDDTESVAPHFSGVIVGKVVTCQPHPNADKLRITKVDIGNDQQLNIVCGAVNCREGLMVACATVGAILPGNFKIKAAKLRGEPSEGMLCSYDELGINEISDGIIELPSDAPLGMDIRDYLKLDDNIINVSITPNRADCLSLLGIARDVAAVNNLRLNEPEVVEITETIDDVYPIQILDKKACPRYLARVIKKININAQTPLWMKEKLRRSGIRSINAIVDVTNYVLLELGQPMHAFDLAKINGTLCVRNANEGEKITTLDGNQLTLSKEVLVIADEKQTLALAGIFGGAESGVSTQTQDILLECAYFNPLAIVGRARRYGLHTESSHRFERGVDPAIQYRAMTRATELILMICGGQAGPIIDHTMEMELPKSATITLHRKKLDALLGYRIDNQKINDILSHLGCTITPKENEWSVKAPTWRFDMQIEEDLIEEIARVYGYNAIPNKPLHTDLAMSSHQESDLALNRLKSLLIDHGYQEVITYSFVDPKIQTLLYPEEEALILPNPISLDMSAMRLSLLPGLLTTLLYNQNRQQHRIRLFESGLSFIPDTNAPLAIRQDFILAGIIAGNRYDEHWDLEKSAIDFYDLKGDLEALLELTGRLDEIHFKVANKTFFHPGQSADIYLVDDLIGHIGVIHPDIAKKIGLNHRAVVFELIWEKINSRVLPRFNEISRFPANRRDIAIIIDESIAASDIINTCKSLIGEQCISVNLFDVYRGDGVAEGQKSLALSFILQNNSYTLEEDEITNLINNCLAGLKQKFNANLRD